MKRFGLALATASLIAASGVTWAATPVTCKTIRMANIGWTDNEIQNAVFSNLAHDLGYHVKIGLYSEEVVYAGMKAKKIDVFLDDWTPSMNKITAPYVKKKEIDVLKHPDLTNAKYTLVVPTDLYNKGLKNFSDIHKVGKALDYKIYGIEPGNDGNEHILSMIKANKFDLGKFHLIQSSEAGMLAEVARRYPKKKAIVFLGWEPEPMNVEFHIRYLSGGHAYFGPHKGQATIYINTRSGYTSECPNIGKLLNQFKLTVADENAMMYKVQVKHEKAENVAKDWLISHPAWVKNTLEGVTTTSGKPATPAVLAALKSH